ncbi:MAG: hypothetical protein KBA75_02220 [Alphaproteobacteria bacterium]|nr:hypothetical protein [Alphaproteobacteria bacterium]
MMSAALGTAGGALLLLLALPAQATETSVPSIGAGKIDTAYVGTWQYPGHTVWITIKPDGKAFQCRVDKDGTTVYRANGVVKGDKVKWDLLWGEDKITARPPGAIVLKGKYGTFHYITALDAEADVCRDRSGE